MSIRGIITVGLLDSPSEMITLGLDAAVIVPPGGAGHKTAANIVQGRSIAAIGKARTNAAVTKSRTIAELDD